MEPGKVDWMRRLAVCFFSWRQRIPDRKERLRGDLQADWLSEAKFEKSETAEGNDGE